MPWDHKRTQGLQCGSMLQEGPGTKREPGGPDHNRAWTTRGPMDYKRAGDRNGALEDNEAWGVQRAWGPQSSLGVTMGSLFEGGPGTTKEPRNHKGAGVHKLAKGHNEA